MPYRDFWYDKPPLSAAFYVLIGAKSGWLLRLFDAAYVFATAALLARLASLWWGPAEGAWAALLFGFFTTFYLPSAVIPFAADAVMMLPHVAAIYCAFRNKYLLAGVWCGVAFLANTKALFVLLVCFAWLPSGAVLLSIGFAGATGAALLSLWFAGAWTPYMEQVWRWGLRYASGSPVAHPLANGVSRTVNWLGFHAALAIVTVAAFRTASRRDAWRLGVWLAASFAAVALGFRFAPHYFLQLLPPLVLAAARGWTVALRSRPRLAYAALVCALVVPVVRFGPRYLTLSLHPDAATWSDAAMDVDSRRVAAIVNIRKVAGDTLFTWGYRPDVYVYTRLVPDGLFSDSQPITGVAADRHLNATSTIYGDAARANRKLFAKTKPVWFIDGLGLLNPRLAPANYSEIASWMSNYQLVAKTPLTLIYKRVKP